MSSLTSVGACGEQAEASRYHRPVFLPGNARHLYGEHYNLNDRLKGSMADVPDTIDEAPGRAAVPAADPRRPLAGLRVLDLSRMVAGGMAGMQLADFGADVVKVEAPADPKRPQAGGGDPLRKWRLLKDGTSVWWQVQSRNKRSVALDLRDPAARDIVRRLARDADVLIENFRPGAMEGWGLGPDELLEINPRLIMLRISGYGQTGPYRDKPGFGVVAEAMSGLRHLTAEPGRVPVRVGVSIGDTLAALHGVIAVSYTHLTLPTNREV